MPDENASAQARIATRHALAHWRDATAHAWDADWKAAYIAASRAMFQAEAAAAWADVGSTPEAFRVAEMVRGFASIVSDAATAARDTACALERCNPAWLRWAESAWRVACDAARVVQRDLVAWLG